MQVECGDSCSFLIPIAEVDCQKTLGISEKRWRYWSLWIMRHLNLNISDSFLSCSILARHFDSSATSSFSRRQEIFSWLLNVFFDWVSFCFVCSSSCCVRSRFERRSCFSFVNSVRAFDLQIRVSLWSCISLIMPLYSLMSEAGERENIPKILCSGVCVQVLCCRRSIFAWYQVYFFVRSYQFQFEIWKMHLKTKVRSLKFSLIFYQIENAFTNKLDSFKSNVETTVKGLSPTVIASLLWLNAPQIWFNSKGALIVLVHITSKKPALWKPIAYICERRGHW